MMPNQYIKENGIIQLQRYTTNTKTEVELSCKSIVTETDFRACCIALKKLQPTKWDH